MSAREGFEPQIDELAENLEEDLAESIPGLEVIDRDLELVPGQSADLVCVDGKGRLVLVLVVDGHGTKPVLSALDCLAVARTQRGLLARHFSNPHLDPSLDPQVVLVSDGFAGQVVQRLSALMKDEVRLFEMRELKSLGASGTYLVQVEIPPVRTVVQASSAAEGFLAELPEGLRAKADQLVRKLGRVDQDVECKVSETGVEWLYRGSVICGLSEREGHLVGRLARGLDPMELDREGEFEDFLDETLSGYVDLLDGSSREEDLAEIELIPADPGMLLTPDEIEAFRV